ncbi:hypothetical protein [Nitrobacter winogradskyi]|uniref:Uncharacterized protein n=1 Tax=Nitrobacter winogradskyi TaxID=913 RepID=A0ACC6AE93_NITWI|nr:hypothetical protein [Nitrobacter winogradskyi]MCP1997931.1 hypothetical protein [Nitrobacter winogradskyi]
MPELSAEAKAQWRSMSPADLPQVSAIAASTRLRSTSGYSNASAFMVQPLQSLSASD